MFDIKRLMGIWSEICSGSKSRIPGTNWENAVHTEKTLNQYMVQVRAWVIPIPSIHLYCCLYSCPTLQSFFLFIYHISLCCIMLQSVDLYILYMCVYLTWKTVYLYEYEPCSMNCQLPFLHFTLSLLFSCHLDCSDVSSVLPSLILFFDEEWQLKYNIMYTYYLYLFLDYFEPLFIWLNWEISVCMMELTTSHINSFLPTGKLILTPELF